MVLRFRRLTTDWRRCRSGSISVVIALGVPVLFGIAGVAFDYATFSRQSSQLQTAADAAALAATRELQVGSPNQAKIQAIAEAVVASHFTLRAGDGPVKTFAKTAYIPPAAKGSDRTAQPTHNSVTVTLGQRKDAIMSRLVTPELTDINVAATAQLAGTTKLCVISLDETAPDSISLKSTARISAGDCSVYANSRDPAAIRSQANAKITALLACSADGYIGAAASFSPRPPLTDCPKQPDPLASRPQPSVGPCVKTNHVVKRGAVGLRQILEPGTYCGGVRVEPGASAELRTGGVYVMKDGPLIVGSAMISTGGGDDDDDDDGGGLKLAPGTLKGTNVGIFFTGTVVPDKDGAVRPLHFMADSLVELTALKAGPMAGLLFFEDRTAPLARIFDIRSDSARKLVGTIYLSRGIFSVNARQKVADQSEYTAIVTRRIHLDQAPNLVLNTRYSDTDVPVPEGLGPNSSSSRLVY